MNRMLQLWIVWLRRASADWLERAKMREQFFMISVAMIIGVLCGFGAVGFRQLVNFFHVVFWGEWLITPELLATFPWWKILLIPAAGGLVVGPIIYLFAREAKGHGVSEVMESLAREGGVIRGRVALVKAIASAITIGSGGSAGREGPIIQIGSAIGSVVGQLLQVSRKRMRTFVGCGAAAGLAATFNAPIGGALFAVEVILGEFGMAQFSPIVISSVLATAVARHYLGGGPVFTVPDYQLASLWEFGPYLLLGALCGLVSVLFIRTLYATEDAFERMERWPAWAKPVLGGLIVGALGLSLPHIMGDGEHVINLALTNQLSWWIMALIFLAKILATACTLGSGGSGGVFAPSLFMGAAAGGALGHGVGVLMGASAGEAGGYALVGMGGLVAGTTHAPITAILMIFEITNNYHIILPLILVCVISITLSSRLHRESIYTLSLVRKGIDMFRGRSLDVLKPYRVRDALHHDMVTFSPDASLREVQEKVHEVDHTFFYITDEGRLMGVIHLSELSRVMARQAGLDQVLLALDLAHEDSCACKASDPISLALVRFEQSGLTELPVVDDRDNDKLLGVVRYVEVVGLYNREIFKQETADTLASHVTSSGRMEKVKIVEGVSMMEWDPPPSWSGLTLAEAHLPTRYGVRVMLVKRRAEGDTDATIAPISPGGGYRIEPGDTLLVYGPDADLARLERL